MLTEPFIVARLVCQLLEVDDVGRRVELVSARWITDAVIGHFDKTAHIITKQNGLRSKQNESLSRS